MPHKYYLRRFIIKFIFTEVFSLIIFSYTLYLYYYCLYKGVSMKKILIAIIFGLLISSTVFAMSQSRGNHHHRHNAYSNNPDRDNDNKPNPGGSGVPEPVSLALILAGGAAAYGIKRAIKK